MAKIYHPPDGTSIPARIRRALRYVDGSRGALLTLTTGEPGGGEEYRDFNLSKLGTQSVVKVRWPEKVCFIEACSIFGYLIYQPRLVILRSSLQWLSWI